MNEQELLKELLKEVKILRRDVDDLRKMFVAEKELSYQQSKTDAGVDDDYISDGEIDKMPVEDIYDKFDELLRKRGYIVKIYKVKETKDKDTDEIKHVRGDYIGSRATPLHFGTIAKLIKKKVWNAKWEHYYFQIVKTVLDDTTGKRSQHKIARMLISVDPNDDYKDWV